MGEFVLEGEGGSLHVPLVHTGCGLLRQESTPGQSGWSGLPTSPWGMNDHVSAALGSQRQLSPGLSDSQVYAETGMGGRGTHAAFLALLFSAESFLPAHQGALTCPHSEGLNMKGTDFHAMLRLHKH